MPNPVRKSKWDAWWVDVLLALSIFASAQVIVVGASHGVGFMGNLLLEAPLEMLAPFWGGFIYTAGLLMVGSPSPCSVKRWLRLLCVGAGFGYTLLYISFSDIPEITALSSIPVGVMLLGLIVASCGSEVANKRRRGRG